MKKNKNNIRWFLLGVLAVLLGAPNNIAIRQVVTDVDPVAFNVMRFGLISLVVSPYLLMKRRSFTKSAWFYSLFVGLFMTVAVTTHVWAIEQSQASYVAILTLMTPIIFIFYSIKINKEKLNRRSFAGITLAAAGAFTVIALPVVLRQGSDFVFYPLATLLVLVRSLSFPLAIIYAKKAHDAGAPIMAAMGVSSLVVFILSCIMMPFVTGGMLPILQSGDLWGLLYSAFAVALLARLFNIVSYEKIGAVASSTLSYAEAFLAVLLPIFVLHEKLSVEVVLGGVLILVGVYLVEHHKLPHAKHARILKHD